MLIILLALYLLSHDPVVLYNNNGGIWMTTVKGTVLLL